MSKQTAVEWLVEKLNQNFDYVADTLIEQTKEMEKEQIIDAHLIGLITSMEMEATKQSEQYYNETFKNS
jgi:hypothetical protein